MNKMLDSDFGLTMKSFGFRKKGLTYRLGDPGEPQVMIAIQSHSIPGYLTAFMVDVGVMPQPWIDLYEWFGTEPVGDLEYRSSVLGNWIDPLEDVALRLPNYPGRVDPKRYRRPATPGVSGTRRGHGRAEKIVERTTYRRVGRTPAAEAD